MMKGIPIVVAAACVSLWAATPASGADSGKAAPSPMTVTKASGEVSIVPQPSLVNGELILKVVALNQSQKPATFGPQDIQITTADGKTVPVMTLDALIALVKDDARAGATAPASYNPSYASGPATTYSQSGAPDVHNFTGSSAPISGQINPEAPVGNARVDSAALEQQIASLKAGILQDVTIGPGEVKGGEVVSHPIRFHWREKHTLRITVRFNGEQYDFEMAAPPEA